MRGIYQHCKEKHLHRYLAEFNFRYNNRIALGLNDRDRAVEALRARNKTTSGCPPALGIMAQAGVCYQL